MRPRPSADDMPLGATAAQITAGSKHNFALLATGAVRSWGYNGRRGVALHATP